MQTLSKVNPGQLNSGLTVDIASLCALNKAPGLYLEVLHVAPSEKSQYGIVSQDVALHLQQICLLFHAGKAKYLLVPCPVTPCLEQPTSEPKWLTSPI